MTTLKKNLHSFLILSVSNKKADTSFDVSAKINPCP